MTNVLKKYQFLRTATFYRRLAMAILIVLILVRPTISSQKSEREMSNLSVWLVADATGSMVAKDIDNGNKRRFEKVQDDVVKIVSGLHGAKYSVIVQDYSTYSAVPMTSNTDAIISAAPFFKPKDSLFTKPSDISELFSYANERISRYKERHPERNNAIIFMSDGEDVSGKQIKIPDTIASLVDKAIVLGYGTAQGSLIESIGEMNNGDYDYSAISDEYILYFGDNPNVSVDSNHQVISKLNESNLQQIAKTLNGDYYNRESGDLADSIISSLSSVASINHDSSGSSVNTGAEIYWLFAIILLLLLAWEGEEVLTRILLERNEKNG